ncbi:hypothetical protein AMATHDRAFT_2473 [Amanita thiersii Skay4041]|uniref:Uncharacterized protein n=1 Tax=Amanita thiersii Skay4041 TaxID=703135 RepID=A0A2A9NRM6_9AGAR|nr:hypothetical protein AMATHDRAFT_2473 [Amanita thiersii Skay4041]
MASFSPNIDRLSRSSQAIAKAAQATAHHHHPLFANALLHTPLGDLIRDIDHSELGLFHLTTSSVTRIDFPNPTPLKRALSRRDDVSKPSVDPEVYAQAAIKFIDRYDPIRPMPRARSQARSILERLDAVRQSIRTLANSLEQINSAEVPSLEPLCETEEKRIESLLHELTILKRRKQAGLQRKASTRDVEHEKRASSREEKNWPTSVAPIKTPQSAGNLIDDINNAADAPALRNTPSPPTQRCNSDNGRSPTNVTSLSQIQVMKDTRNLVTNNLDTHEAEDFDNMNTNPENHPSSTVGSIQPSRSFNDPETLNITYHTIRMCAELDHIVEKIWYAGANVISFDMLEKTTSPVPSAKQIITRLQTLSQLPIPPAATELSAPAATSTQHASQQILTAYLLLSLLYSPPDFSIPLSRAKELLATKNDGSDKGIESQNINRTIYGCVAKRLIRIDRSGREQIVRFDV